MDSVLSVQMQKNQMRLLVSVLHVSVNESCLKVHVSMYFIRIVYVYATLYYEYYLNPERRITYSLGTSVNIKSLFFNFHDVMKTVSGAKIP